MVNGTMGIRCDHFTYKWLPRNTRTQTEARRSKPSCLTTINSLAISKVFPPVPLRSTGLFLSLNYREAKDFPVFWVYEQINTGKESKYESMPITSRLSIEDFKSNLVNGGVRPTMFYVSISFPQVITNLLNLINYQRDYSQQTLDKLTFLCKAASIPASTLTTVNAGLPAGGQLKLPGSRLFDPWSTTIISDGQMAIRALLEDWMQMIIGHESQLSLMELDRYMATANVVQLDRQGKELRGYELKGIYPTTLDPIDLAFDATDTIEEFQCVFNYHYWQASQSSSLEKLGVVQREKLNQIFV